MSCSFCSRRGHNIRNCMDPTISILYERMKVIYIDILTLNIEDIEIMFKSVLDRRFGLVQLRAVCAKYTNYSVTRTKSNIINILYQHIRNNIYSAPQQEPQWLEVRGIPNMPDPIPDFAHDLVEEQPESQEEPDYNITWYIDTTPSPVSIIGLNMFVAPSVAPGSLSHQIIGGRIENNRIEYWTQFGETMRNLNPVFNVVAGVSYPKKYKIVLNLIEEEKREKEEKEECGICYESINCIDLVKLNCKHKFCGSCITKTLKHHNGYDNPTCAFCREPMTTFNVKNPDIYNLVTEYCN